jgi:hypothetical protein
MPNVSLMRPSVVVIACLLSTAAFAKRPYAPQLSCDALKEIVESRGAAVISTGPSTYDRFVHGGQYCERTQVTEPAWIPSADQDDCFVGYTCREFNRNSW